MAAIALAGTLLAAATPDKPAPIREVPISGRVDLLLAGRTVSVRAEPGMPSRLYLSRTLATAMLDGEAGVFADRKRGFSLIQINRATDAKVGPVEIKGRAESIRLGSGRDKIGVSWFEADAYPGDALAGPWALPEPAVRFHLGPAQPRDVTTAFPLGSRYDWWIATTPREMGGKTVHFAFAPHFPRTVASAAAGAAIARELGGRFDGSARPVLISHKVQRPARAMRLDRPLAFGAVAIDQLLVRTADYGSTSGIVDPDAAESGEDIVVKGRRGSRPSYVVYLGADLLGTCSSILYDKPARRIDLTCPAPLG